MARSYFVSALLLVETSCGTAPCEFPIVEDREYTIDADGVLGGTPTATLTPDAVVIRYTTESGAIVEVTYDSTTAGE